jgi:two-component system, OmpR family, KDP operon response regulator KdpE
MCSFTGYVSSSEACDLEGVEITRRIREWSRMPSYILSVCNQEQNKIEALDAGTDDYLAELGVG